MSDVAPKGLLPKSSLSSCTQMSLMARCAYLSVAMLLFYPIPVQTALASDPATAYRVTATAAIVVWFGAISALVVTYFSSAPKFSVAGGLSAMMFRLGLPLLAGISLNTHEDPLAKAGIFGYILCFYLFALPVEVLLSLAPKETDPKETLTDIMKAS